MGSISLILILGARLAQATPCMDLDFWNYILMKSVPLTMSSFSSSSVLSQLVHLLKPNMLLLSLFFFQICHCTKEAHEKKQLRPYQQALLRLQIQICAPAWSWVAGDLAGKGISWNVGTQKPEVRWLWGWQIGYASAHLEVTGSHLT